MRSMKRPGTARKRKGPSRRREIKQRKTFTLSPEAVAILEKLSMQRSAGGQDSVSAFLDELLLMVGEEQRRREIEQGTQKYYDEQSAQDEEEEVAWAKFALSQFPVRNVSEEETK